MITQASDGKNQEHPFRLRTATYWLLSEYLPKPFIPDFMRIPLIAGYTTRIKQNIKLPRSLHIQSKVDEYIRNQARQLRRFPYPEPIPIPNTTLSFLNKYATSKSVEVFTDLRKEFQNDRVEIIKWEDKLKQAPEVGYIEAIKAADEIAKSLDSIKRTDRWKVGLSIGMAALTDLFNLSPGKKTAESLVREGVEIIRRLRGRAKINYFYTGIQQSNNFKRRHELLKKAFGESLTPSQASRFKHLTQYLDKLAEPV